MTFRHCLPLALAAALALLPLFAVAAAPAAETESPDTAPAEAEGAAPAPEGAGDAAGDASGDPAQAEGADEGPGPLEPEPLRDVIEKWMETRRAIAREKAEWRQTRQMLESRIALLEREIASVDDRIEGTETDIEKARSERETLENRRDRLASATEALAGQVGELEGRVRRLLERLPPRAREAVKALAERIPGAEDSEAAEATDRTLSQRFQNLAGIANEMNKMHAEVALEREVRELADGRAMQVRVLYMGLGHAWYVGERGEVAGVGTVSKETWTWQEVPEAAPAIRKAIAIMENEEVAAFVPLPFATQK